jgi:hypothetical protein
MSWNGHPVIDLDAHVVERADRFHRDYQDPAKRRILSDNARRLLPASARLNGPALARRREERTSL